MIQLKGIIKESSTFSKLLLLIGTSSFFTLLALLLWKIISNGNVADIQSIKLMQFLQSIGMFVIPPFVLAYFWSKKPFRLLQLDRQTDWKNTISIAFLMIVAIPFINLLGELNQHLVLPDALASIEAMMKAAELETAQLTEKLLNVNRLDSLLLNIFLIAMLPALGEELFFRGVLQRIFTDWNGAVIAIWLTAFIFSAIHFQFYGFLPRMLLGAFFGYLVLWTGNLWIPIFAHFINNFMAVIFYYLKNNGYSVLDIDIVGTGNTQWVGWVSGCITLTAVVWYRARNKSLCSEPE